MDIFISPPMGPWTSRRKVSEVVRELSPEDFSSSSTAQVLRDFPHLH